ncbi:TetR/AcrR family transcriptional regulator [Maritalea mediterranea]|uniref:TetR/AcrR family transcriptional regulator n=1 Tax=Maritalea mediterranea TaxID=2909667 RepID=A0ABS9E4V0_9HYPH|nr:TetR/AcrR family transcriptional regulator [Maritalea mediterranea]MCF4097832.1 TetR/AcrR family transcriptional regulator [Maritalea mediterranea]
MSSLAKQPASPRKRPRQARARVTVDAILQASTRILQKQGLEKFNTNHIADVAGVSVGTLYQYFPSKDAILIELIRQKRSQLSDALADAAAQSADLTLEQALDNLLRVTIAHQLSWPMVGRTLDYAESFLPLADESFNFKRELTDIISTLLAKFSVPNADMVARDLIFALNGLIEGILATHNADADQIFTRAQFLAHGYINAVREN